MKLHFCLQAQMVCLLKLNRIISIMTKISKKLGRACGPEVWPRHIAINAKISGSREQSSKESFFSAGTAFTPSTRPSFDSYFHALRGNGGIEHFFCNFSEDPEAPNATRVKISNFCHFFLKIYLANTIISLHKKVSKD